MRARALNIVQWHKRVGFIEDIELFANVARQFVDVAGCNDTQAAHIAVPIDDDRRGPLGQPAVGEDFRCISANY